MKVPVKNMAGENVGEVELNKLIFEAPINTALMHQALTRQLANARQGTAKTKTRGEVAGSTRKVWRQKHTGRARQGSRKAPQWRKGGTVFGPSPRSYRQRMPKNMRHAALRSALSVKAADNQIVVLDALMLDAPKTKAMADMLRNLEVGRSALILLSEGSPTVERSIRNLEGVQYLRAQYLNVRDLLGAETVVVPQSALDAIDELLG
uniref:Large ribosomal subunit protein uL4 n=1 Tax=uncultured Chloroflexi bacterium Rifle_16ft_4_minimus_3189 TaxID=1665068 RepID=A0A0H4T6G7_9CHLR|nr:50S ribosomal protein L4, large subunit ribosomal protein L4 [uncultured Chloroflexi bacterium Rifle_16ft_4_minimus_3189]